MPKYCARRRIVYQRGMKPRAFGPRYSMIMMMEIRAVDGEARGN